MKLLSKLEYFAKCYQCGAESDRGSSYAYTETLAFDQGFRVADYHDHEIVLCGQCGRSSAEDKERNDAVKAVLGGFTRAS